MTTKDDWLCGFACAMALCVRAHHEHYVVVDATRGVVTPKSPRGGMREVFSDGGAEAYDLEQIDLAFDRSNYRAEWFGEGEGTR